MVVSTTWREFAATFFLFIFWMPNACLAQKYWFDYAPSRRNVGSSQLSFASSSSTPSPDDIIELPSVGYESKCVDYCKRYPSCIDILMTAALDSCLVLIWQQVLDQRAKFKALCRLRLLPFDSDFISFDRPPNRHQQLNHLHDLKDSEKSPQYPLYASSETNFRESAFGGPDNHDHPASSKPHSRRHAIHSPMGNAHEEYNHASESVTGIRSPPARRSTSFSTSNQLRQPSGSLTVDRPYTPANGFGRDETLANGDVDYTKYIIEPQSTNGKAIFKPARLDAQYSALPSQQVGATIVVRRPKRDASSARILAAESLQLTCGVVRNLTDTRTGRVPKSFEGRKPSSPPFWSMNSANRTSFGFDVTSTRPRPSFDRPSRRPAAPPSSSSGHQGVSRNPKNGGPSTSLRPPLPANHWWFQLPTTSPAGVDSRNSTKRDRREFTLHGNGKNSALSPGSKDVLNRPYYYNPPAFRPTSNGPQSLDDRFAKIIGGTDAAYGAFPWQAEIEGYSVTERRYKHHCGGALISQWHVLTAAHCVRAKSKEYLKVRLGEHRLDTSDSHESTYRIADMVYHENHRELGPFSNDIGVLKLDREVVFSDYIKPICLPQSEDQYVIGTWCTVSGWGLQDAKNTKSLSNTLKAARVPIIADETCKRDDVYGRRSQKILPGMFCAGFLEGGTDACGGDSGGPLSCQINGRYVALGLVSWGDGCANKDRPGVYVKVFHYLDWINKAVDSL